jgi:hypothetical protein
MGFFDDISREPAESAMLAQPRPDGALPAPMALRLMLVRTERVAIAVTGMWAFATGFEFLLSVQLRDAVPGTATASFLSALDGEPMHEEFLRLGVEFGSGEKAANTQLRASRTTRSDRRGPIMKVRVAGAGLRSRDWTYWVSPLPPAGPLAFVCEWPALGIAESRTEIDARLLLDAARESIELWS